MELVEPHPSQQVEPPKPYAAQVKCICHFIAAVIAQKEPSQVHKNKVLYQGLLASLLGARTLRT